MLASLWSLVPWRYRSISNFAKAHSNAMFRTVQYTPPVNCAVESETEVHALVCKRDVNMLLVAAKSFLRYAPDLAMVIHDDGTLENGDCANLSEHLPNCRLIRRADADDALGKLLPGDMMAYRKASAFLVKLFDFNYYLRGRKLIALDSDIVFRREPVAVIDWIRHGGGSIYNQDPMDTFRASSNPGNRSLPPNFNAGFMGFEGPISIGEIEAAIRAMDYWAEDQTIYAWLLADRQPHALDPKDYFVFDGVGIPDTACMVHFISPNRFTTMTYLREVRRQCKLMHKT